MRRRPAAVVAALIVGCVSGCGASVTHADALNYCRNFVVDWSCADVADVVGEDVSSENLSGDAWDFHGTYPGGTWACGGPAGQREASQIIAWTSDGAAVTLKTR